MKRDDFRARVLNLSDAPFSDASVGMRSSARSQRKSRSFRKQDCDFLMLTATNIFICSRLSTKSLGVLPTRWRMFGFGILLAPGENRRVRRWDGGCSGLV